MDDNKIIDLYLRRDETAVKQTSEKFGDHLRALVYGIVKDHQTAEECENDTYLKAWSSIPPHEPREYLYAFLARITRHISLDCCRKRSRLKRRAFISELSSEMEQCIPASDDVECRIDDIILGQAINGFLSTLNEEKRNVFIELCQITSGNRIVDHVHKARTGKISEPHFAFLCVCRSHP